jgi:uncharacterized protein YutE (UPF0331/DUF86 family)
MVDRDVLTRRLLVLAECLRELERPAASDAAKLAADAVLRAAVERWLQVAIEACVDMASHVVADEGWTPPSTGREALLLLASHGRLPLDLAQRLGAAVGLRNILVHDYVTVDLAQLAATVRDDLGDLRTFAGIAGEWLRQAEA